METLDFKSWLLSDKKWLMPSTELWDSRASAEFQSLGYDPKVIISTYPPHYILFLAERLDIITASEFLNFVVKTISLLPQLITHNAEWHEKALDTTSFINVSWAAKIIDSRMLTKHKNAILSIPTMPLGGYTHRAELAVAKACECIDSSENCFVFAECAMDWAFQAISEYTWETKDTTIQNSLVEMYAPLREAVAAKFNVALPVAA